MAESNDAVSCREEKVAEVTQVEGPLIFRDGARSFDCVTLRSG